MSTVDPTLSARELLRTRVVAAVRAAIASLDPARLVEDALPPRPPKRARVVVVAAGKASARMASGALRRWPDAIARVHVVTTDALAARAASELPPSSAEIVIHAAAHPTPDGRSAAAAEACLSDAAKLGRSDLLLALVSGGCSAVMALPPASLSLDDKSGAVRRLLASGASIRDVNTVRRHLSRIKGGHLAEAAFPARVLTLIVSDVIGGAPHDIGSGPTVADPTTIDDARRVLERAAPELVATLGARLVESLKPKTPVAARTRAMIVARPEELGRRVVEELRAAGLDARAREPDEGDARAIAEDRARIAAALAPGEAVVVPCEPTLALPQSPGHGGRAGWTALAAAAALPPQCVLVCVASDGVDGTSGAAGAAIARADVEGHDAEIDAALAAYDDAPLHRFLGTAVELGPTGTNLTDVHVVARCA